ncbi:hypothetical protein [Sinorhizobium medicae]|uniref:hypothetical protein n=1 Tax=Sinorhizobium medicae TaxID=110321 RepID=UPI000FDA5088|nr:hypothetical protein [Sinorhizobium medicae]RVP47342.1 hypothetical protein CN078_26875 [Sinorhizobium medicae]RVP75445.1 hypothetical protein CN079_20130 [Sinorhizobium medicae]UWU06579.1 hypothetical protein N2598_09290 [Sinorhizobium medicae]
MPNDQFPLRPDRDWYDALRARYGDAIPAIEYLQIRRGLQSIVEDLFEKLDIADRFNVCRVYGIATRNAGFTVVDARYSETATEADKRMCNRVIERVQERLVESCEHCGRTGETIAKVGLEARLQDPDIVLGDRLLCAECYESWRSR